MSDTVKCKKCKRPIGYLAESTDGLCPRCLLLESKGDNPFNEKPDNEDK